MQRINRCRITEVFYKDLVHALQGKPASDKALTFIKKWPIKLKEKKLYSGTKEIIPVEKINTILKYQAENNGMPLSRDGAFHYISTKYACITKRAIARFIKRVEQLQMIHKRPYKQTRQNTNSKEGSMNVLLSSKYGGRYNLGVDLFETPREWTQYKYFL